MPKSTIIPSHENLSTEISAASSSVKFLGVGRLCYLETGRLSGTTMAWNNFRKFFSAAAHRVFCSRCYPRLPSCIFSDSLHTVRLSYSVFLLYWLAAGIALESILRPVRKSG